MTWKPIIAGVDPTVEGMRAATAAAGLAERAGTSCHLVHAVHNPWVDVSQAEFPMNVAALNQQLFDVADTRIRGMLQTLVPGDVLRSLELRMGSASVVLDDVIDERNAELLVLGGKHHSTLGRWLAGSTAHLMVRRADVPLLVTNEWTGKIRRVLAAVDLSSAARPTIAAAERMAALYEAPLAVLHVVEPLPVMEGVTLTVTPDEMLENSQEELEGSVWPFITNPATERVVREGPAIETVSRLVHEWDIDLLVVGSHGRGWVDRLLIGSVTEDLLSRLPTSMLVVPISNPARENAHAKQRAERRPDIALVRN